MYLNPELLFLIKMEAYIINIQFSTNRNLNHTLYTFAKII
jgi:hypothetical protein